MLRINGWRLVVYPNDHPPAHVHVIGPGWVAVVDLLGLELREATGCREADARRVLTEVGQHRMALLDAWRRYHG